MTPCKIWTGAKTQDGYGQRIYEGATRRVHRIAYCEAHGLSLSDIAGKVVLHACDNPACYNPEHLSLGTQGDNVRDCIQKGRFRRHDGIHNNRAKLNLTLAQQIRVDYITTLSYSTLAIKYGVGKSTVARVINREIWNE